MFNKYVLLSGIDTLFDTMVIIQNCLCIDRLMFTCAVTFVIIKINSLRKQHSIAMTALDLIWSIWCTFQTTNIMYLSDLMIFNDIDRAVLLYYMREYCIIFHYNNIIVSFIMTVFTVLSSFVIVHNGTVFYIVYYSIILSYIFV